LLPVLIQERAQRLISAHSLGNYKLHGRPKHGANPVGVDRAVLAESPAIPSCDSGAFRVGSGLIFLLESIDSSPGHPQATNFDERATISPRTHGSPCCC
jgi:hypothetical protein